MNKALAVDNAPIHEWFELSYASYLVLPRSVLQSAPVEWQRRFVEGLNELEEMFGSIPDKGTYQVYLKDNSGKFIRDYYKDYERGRREIPMINQDSKD